MRIGVDLLGSDSAPELLFEAVLQIAKELEESDSLVVYVNHENVEKLLRTGQGASWKEKGASQIDLHVVEEYITLEDDPLSSVRLKKNSSLVVGIRQLSDRKIDAFVTAGNTGALITGTTIILPQLSGMERPALLAVLPTQGRPLAMMDVGGLVSCKACQLVQYAHIGAAFQCCTLEVDVPTVGLLNIGMESKKGNGRSS